MHDHCKTLDSMTIKLPLVKEYTVHENPNTIYATYNIIITYNLINRKLHTLNSVINKFL